MQKRIRESANGGYVVEFGNPIEERPNPSGIGYIMKGFLVYQMCRCDTLEEAEQAEMF